MAHWHEYEEHRARRRERAEAWREHLRERFGIEPEEHWFLGGRRFRACCCAPWEMQGPNPLVGLLLSRGGGLLPVYVLHLLAGGPRYGNEIMRELEERTEGGWVSNPGAIYPLLSMLEAEGVVEGSWETPHKRHRRFYHLTPLGQAQLQQLKELVRPGLVGALHTLERLVEELCPEDS